TCGGRLAIGDTSLALPLQCLETTLSPRHAVLLRRNVRPALPSGPLLRAIPQRGKNDIVSRTSDAKHRAVGAQTGSLEMVPHRSPPDSSYRLPVGPSATWSRRRASTRSISLRPAGNRRSASAASSHCNRSYFA